MNTYVPQCTKLRKIFTSLAIYKPHEYKLKVCVVK